MFGSQSKRLLHIEEDKIFDANCAKYLAITIGEKNESI
tara:strand:- start:428 stop:541 length:114 start_codon:yes stop_codon:yes gene_type:complete